MKSVFITGVDTNIGKTFVSIGLCLANKNKGLKVGYYKPFQSGAYKQDDVLIAPDIYEFKKYSNDSNSIKTKYSHLFKGEISPHLACLINDIDIDLNKIKKDFDDFSRDIDLMIIEGAGGLFCPACKGKLFSDIIKLLNQEIIIVTPPSLGRLNHLLMTVKCAQDCEIKIKGIIINLMSENPTLSEKNFIKELKCFSDVEILGTIPKFNSFEKAKIIKEFEKIKLD